MTIRPRRPLNINKEDHRNRTTWRRDYKRQLKRADLDEMSRARPSTWARYCATSQIIKVVTRKPPQRLYETLTSQMYLERRRPMRMKFYSKVDYCIRRQSLVNQAPDLIIGLNFYWKQQLNMASGKGEGFFPLGGTFRVQGQKIQFFPLLFKFLASLQVPMPSHMHKVANHRRESFHPDNVL